MRPAILLLCVPLTACAGGDPLAPQVHAPAAAVAVPVAAAPIQQPAAPPEPPLAESDRLTQARADCWMKADHQSGMRDIDRRIAFVDKCVAGAVGVPPR
jgi:hypothetical protein